jgi:hypothetical protein
MKFKKTSLLLVMLSLFVGYNSTAQVLVHYWNFNDNSTIDALLTPSQSLVSGASITHVPGGISAIDLGGTGQNFNLENLNARNGDASGTHLRFNDPIGGALEFALPTTGFQDVVINFATRRSGSGAGEQLWYYSTDNGANYSFFSSVIPNNGDPQLATLDFSSIPAVNDNSGFRLKVEFIQASGGTVGNNRFDNFTLDGEQVPQEVLIHYWNFNDNTSVPALLTPTVSLVSGASIAHVAGGISTIDLNGTGQNFNIENLNARNGDPSGTHLRFNDPIGGALEFAVPTTGFEDITVKFPTRRSGSGAGEQHWYYSVNGGVDYTFFQTILPNNGDPLMEVLDFTSITAVEDNANFKLRVEFTQGPGGTVGNNRFDNYTVDGYPIGGGDNIPPTVSFNPLNNSINIPITVNPVLTFNEPVRLLDNSPLTNANAASVIELRLNDENGALIPFTTDVTSTTITVIPTSNLDNNQLVYLALLENTVEDLSDNAIASAQSITFTTISLQTQFEAGDMVITAYRMNSTGTEDEIALLTFVDIIPGTFINITDSKYTSNAQAQCTGGLVWTAGSEECVTAGTVIYIQTSAMVASHGSLTGSGFGLSSGGDQVIVYTGTAANPNYITALSANEWLTTNTNCGGSNSMLPAGLVDGVSSINLSTAPDNVSGLTVNAYYNGTQTGTPAELRTEILNPANWIGSGSGTPAQEWPLYSFPGAPAILQATVLNQTTIRLVFSTALDQVSAENPSNYTGIADLASVTMSQNGTLADTVILVYSTPFVSGATQTLQVSGVEDLSGTEMSCPFSFTFTYNTFISFASNFVVVEENHGTLQVALTFENPSACQVDVNLKPAPFSTADANDFTFTSTTLSLTGADNASQFLAIPILDDNQEEQMAEYFVMVLENAAGCSITGDPMLTVYIRDNDRGAKTPSESIELIHVTSFDPSGANTSTCEVVAYDTESQRLFTTSAIAGYLEIIDFSNPADLTLISAIDVNSYGGITSVAVKNGLVAVASPNADEQLDGSVVFFDINGNFISQVTVGALPDMITFTPDGTKVLTANEGQPNNAYTIDPEGSVSIISLANGAANLTQADVTTLYFTGFNADEANLIASGVRKTKSTSTLSQDLEPEYITVGSDSQQAWVTLQENNAIAEINLGDLSITSLWAMGTKDVSAFGNGFDVSDNNNEILISNWPLKAYFIPDAVANYTVNGTTYLVTANEGDEKEYGGLNERTTVGANGYVLDPVAFPHAAMLKKSYNLGRMRVSNLNGDLDGDGDFDEIYCVGSRSFSIFDAATGELVYDSGDDFEMYTALTPAYSPLFNADHGNNTAKGRSRAKGPEPEGITLGQFGDKTYAFIALERIGGVMVYDITNPISPEFVDYKNTRNLISLGGDLGAETLTFIPAAESPTNKAYIILANEISGTLTVFEVKDNNDYTASLENKSTVQPFMVYPNPSGGQLVKMNKMVGVVVTDMAGKVVFQSELTQTIDTRSFESGVYMVRTHDGQMARLVVQH